MISVACIGFKARYQYFGARYYDSDLSVWLSVDPASDRYPSTSPFMYVRGNPIDLIDPNGLWDQDADGNWTATKGDSWWKLHKQSGMSWKETIAYAKKYNADKGRDNWKSVRVGDKVSLPGNETTAENSSQDGTTNSNISTSNNSNSANASDWHPPMSSQNDADNANEPNNTIKDVNTVSGIAGTTISVTQQIVKNPNVAYNIAYNNKLLNGVRYLKPAGYGFSILSVGTDITLSVQGQQSWGETGLNTGVTGLSLFVGGAPGIVIQLNYQASKSYMKAVKKHPDRVMPASTRCFTH